MEPLGLMESDLDKAGGVMSIVSGSSFAGTSSDRAEIDSDAADVSGSADALRFLDDVQKHVEEGVDVKYARGGIFFDRCSLIFSVLC